MKTVIDKYLARVAPGQRAALERLRRTIRAAAPEAEECISYGLAAFRLDGKPLVAFGASKGHCAFFPMNGASVKAHRGELEGRETSKGTIRFQPDDPLPASLVRAIVRERIEENRSKEGAGSRKGKGADEIAAYARAQPPASRAICDRLRAMIDAAIPKASSKVWHGSPVWFVGENPVVGYSASRKGVALLFWNGRAIDAGLEPVGKHGAAAQARFQQAADVDGKVVRGWLRKAGRDVFDSKAHFRKLREARK